ncbi:helix-turn-helix transcriptional regulator [Mesonia ostreae]|uniref:AraC family transcriptional regulator n=1 Tax=Mesonia ostreae TaxID=861110 RepID=A0ABU2KE98_9FLAO|nr:AraC family transcriptional regulator [Mesonia ostreae]MDT0293032.1 AraC family transcriptional regulator [Mesonia ostreae]
MTTKFNVRSLPLRDVVSDLANEMNTSFHEKCTEYIVNIPEKIGSGEIRGINFDNGLGIIVYRCKFKQATEISFTVDKVHPLKYIYTANGFLKHQFSNEDIVHELKPRMATLVASEEHNGHNLYFEGNVDIDLVSLEIDRKTFKRKSECEQVHLSAQLQNLFSDTNASETFYHEGFYSLEFHTILNSIDEYKNELLLRKFHLESKALDIFVEQIQLFEDDLKGNSKELLLRYNELERIKELSDYIEKNLDKDFTIEVLSRQSGLNPNKLQKGFKYIFSKTVRDYIISRRMETAKLLLLTTDQPLTTIANKIGLDSPSYFSKLFKEYFKHTPSNFRKFYNNHS